MDIEEINSTEVRPDNIWNFKQNKVSLMVDLIKNRYPEVETDFLYEVALKTGIFKWLAVRRQLIKLKNELREFDTEYCLRKKRKLHKTVERMIEDRGKHKMLIFIKEAIRKLCHSDRWQCPDHDSRANEWLKNKEKQILNQVKVTYK